MMKAKTLGNYLLALQKQADMTWENEVRLEVGGKTYPMKDYLGVGMPSARPEEWTYKLQVETEDDVKPVVWSPDFEQRLAARLAEYFQQANNVIDFASRSTKPIEGGLIKVEESARSIVDWIKQELGIIEKKEG